jgi:LPXTG-site transpeptidase (sortase) family protein
MRQNTSRINSDEIRSRIRGYQPRSFSDVIVRKPTITNNSRQLLSIEPVKNDAQIRRPFTEKNQSNSVVYDPLPLKREELSNLPTSRKKPSSENTKTKKNEQKNSSKNKMLNNLLLAMAVVVFLVGALASLYSLKVDKQITETVAAQASDPNSDVSEDKPSEEAIRSYSVSPEMPKLIKIPKLGTTARVQQIGLNSNGQLDVPKNIYDAAWYKESALPGSAGGASVIDGHVSGPTQKGVFYNLSDLAEGDSIVIEKGSGEEVNYKVKKVEIQQVNEVDMANMLVPITPGSHGLNLISCTGKYNSEKKDFEQRVLVFAEKYSQ